MKHFRRFLAMTVSLCICCALVPCFSSVHVHASTEQTTISDSIGVPITENTVQDQVELLLDNYFIARCTLDMGNCSILLSNFARQGIIHDEYERIALLNDANVVEMTNDYVVSNYSQHDQYVLVQVTETIAYTTDVSTIEQLIDHNITFFINETGSLIMTRDGYEETFLSFNSSSFWTRVSIPAARTGSNSDLTPTEFDDILTGDFAYDLVEVAKTQEGYHEKASNSQLEYKTANSGSANYTIYGEEYSNGWANGQAWCVMFVSWCAEKAEIPASVGLTHFRVSDFKEAYDDVGLFEDSISQGGTYQPKIGDVVVFDGHVGIVISSNDTYVNVVDGNFYGYDDVTGELCYNEVLIRQCNINSSDILGYATPDYETGGTTHTWSTSFEYDSETHWKCCTLCGKQTASENHRWRTDASGNFKTCMFCGKFVPLIVINTIRPNIPISLRDTKEDSL